MREASSASTRNDLAHRLNPIIMRVFLQSSSWHTFRGGNPRRLSRDSDARMSDALLIPLCLLRCLTDKYEKGFQPVPTMIGDRERGLKRQHFYSGNLSSNMAISEGENVALAITKD